MHHNKALAGIVLQIAFGRPRVQVVYCSCCRGWWAPCSKSVDFTVVRRSIKKKKKRCAQQPFVTRPYALCLSGTSELECFKLLMLPPQSTNDQLDLPAARSIPFGISAFKQSLAPLRSWRTCFFSGKESFKYYSEIELHSWAIIGVFGCSGTV